MHAAGCMLSHNIMRPYNAKLQNKEVHLLPAISPCTQLSALTIQSVVGQKTRSALSLFKVKTQISVLAHLLTAGMKAVLANTWEQAVSIFFRTEEDSTCARGFKWHKSITSLVLKVWTLLSTDGTQGCCSAFAVPPKLFGFLFLLAFEILPQLEAVGALACFLVWKPS